MQIYNCLIVEDEAIAAEVLTDYVNQVPFLALKGVCIDAIYAMEKLQEENIDLAFLDLNLPRLKGLDFLRTLKNPPRVIITTAYHEYALQGYELNVLDYLVKPIEFSRFLTAVNKLESGNMHAHNQEAIDTANTRQYLFFNVNKKQVKVWTDDIIVIESVREYIRIMTASKTILTKMQIGEVELLLPQKDFLRIHRSFIVAVNKIDSFSPSEIEVADKQVPIGRNYKEIVLSTFKINN